MIYCVKRFTLQHSAVIFIFEKDMKFPLLLDIYGVLLSERKRELLELYFNEDYSLTEISELTGISRQGVRDSIRKSKDEISELESKLKIAEKNEISANILRSVIADLNAISAELDKEVENRLKCMIDKLIEVVADLEATHDTEQE